MIMDAKTFDKLVETQFRICKELLGLKATEYVPGSRDRLENFKVAANLCGSTNKQALAGMMAKHTVSVYQMLMDTNEYTEARWAEKITDSINYLLLAKALVYEEADKNTKNNPDQLDFAIAT